ncbi:MAG: ABC transporter permease subunit/CPBP intramembrane protease [Pirellulales bacterium]
MSWQNVKLIFAREVRDQLRDRRTLFMIAVLPMLLYPLLGISSFQVSQFFQEHPTRVLVVGGEELAAHDAPPRLFDADGTNFDPALFANEDKPSLVKLTFVDAADLLPAHGKDDSASAKQLADAARARMREEKFDAVIYFPDGFSHELTAFRAELKSRVANPPEDRPLQDKSADGSSENGSSVDGKSTDSKAATGEEKSPQSDVKKPGIPNPIIYYNTAREASQVARARIEGVFYRWTTKVGEQNLIDSDVPKSAAHPFSLESSDVAEAGRRDAVTWAKILPFVLMIWALTGAFYPAVDLCAGEKERGTLETLLCSPAQRSEIVVGKLLTVMTFSMATAVLNLASMGLTGAILLSSMPQLGNMMQLGMPPVEAIFWLALALPPVSALFGALAVALAAFARSTKEGQYYLMPLILVTMPLMILPMQPSMELTLGTSLIPVTGLMLLLRELVMSNYAVAATFVAPVAGVTLTGCFFAVRWAIDQFNSESVLFRESERLDLGLWLRHLRADRLATPTAAMAIACGLLILLIRFFTTLVITPPETAVGLLVLQAVTLLAFVAAPALMMTVVLTRSPRKTLMLRLPKGQALAACIALAIAFHPLAIVLRDALIWLYPVNSPMLAGMEALFTEVPYVWLVLVFAVLPALCEEVAFRGFILSGLRDMGHPWRAILVSSVLFGVVHLIVQQSINAAILGVLLGYVAIRSGSLLCPIAFHLVHNGLVFALPKLTSDVIAGHRVFDVLLVPTTDGSIIYRTPVVIAAALASMAALTWFRKSTRQTARDAADKFAVAEVVNESPAAVVARREHVPT